MVWCVVLSGPVCGGGKWWGVHVVMSAPMCGFGKWFSVWYWVVNVVLGYKCGTVAVNIITICLCKSHAVLLSSPKLMTVPLI